MAIQQHDADDEAHGKVAIPATHAPGAVDRLVYAVAVRIVRQFVSLGNIRFTLRGQMPVAAGDGSGPVHEFWIEDPAALLRILRNPDLGLGESFMDRQWLLAQGDLAGLLDVLLRSQHAAKRTLVARVYAWLNVLLHRPQANDSSRSRRNASHHYDLGNDLYRAFLDEGMNYSCAFFDRPDMTLREAQLNKIRTTIGRLQIEPGHSVLDIGCGWGEVSRTIARETGATDVVGITLADQQIALAQSLAGAMSGNVLRYALEDYRDHARSHPCAYDRIVSIGMFEHVGRPNFSEYFGAVRDMLKDGGLALVHSITRPSRSWVSPWIDKYIFPGGYIPTLNEMVEAAQCAGLTLAHDPFIHPGINYATTLKHWRQRFNSAWPKLDHNRYDERFHRMWNFYLAGSEAAFRGSGFANAQLLIRKGASA